MKNVLLKSYKRVKKRLNSKISQLKSLNVLQLQLCEILSILFDTNIEYALK